MTATHLQDSDNVVRYVGGSKIRENNRVDGTAFCRRRDEDGPSVNWLELFHGLEKQQQIAEVRRLIHPTYRRVRMHHQRSSFTWIIPR